LLVAARTECRMTQCGGIRAGTPCPSIFNGKKSLCGWS
jgi:hypothetical protein